MKQTQKHQFTQTVDTIRRKTFIPSILEEAEEISKVLTNIQDSDSDPLGEMTKDKYTHKMQRIGTFWAKAEENIPLDHTNSMEMFLYKNKYRRKRANSFDKHILLVKSEIPEKDVVITKVIEDNRKLEEKIEQMQEFSKENEELRIQLSNANSKLTDHEQKVMLEKDHQISELSDTLLQREQRYKDLLKNFQELKKEGKETDEEHLAKLVLEKEEELDKINYMNAEYRAQLIELKISMSKARDATRTDEDDEYVIKLGNHESALDEAKEKISFQQAKIREQDSIIGTLLSQSEYYKDKYKKDEN
mmetsp:Transcript_19850/g.17546  ORF Transcript_19850/g.17546 Transcript_19850/m.17546 type:complete len:304 (-) Transcript_19850:37-948(-)